MCYCTIEPSPCVFVVGDRLLYSISFNCVARSFSWQLGSVPVLFPPWCLYPVRANTKEWCTQMPTWLCTKNKRFLTKRNSRTIDIHKFLLKVHKPYPLWTLESSTPGYVDSLDREVGTRLPAPTQHSPGKQHYRQRRPEHDTPRGGLHAPFSRFNLHKMFYPLSDHRRDL